MTEPLPSDHPNLQQALRRPRRTQWVWAALAAGMAWIGFVLLRGANPVAFLPWLASAVLLAIDIQPAYLALAGVIWGLSLVGLLPGSRNIAGPDPLMTLIQPRGLEAFALGAVRVLLAMTAAAAGSLPLVAGGLSFALPPSEAGLASAQLAMAAAALAVGLGVGAAFSATGRRTAALLGTALGVLGFLPALGGRAGI